MAISADQDTDATGNNISDLKQRNQQSNSQQTQPQPDQIQNQIEALLTNLRTILLPTDQTRIRIYGTLVANPYLSTFLAAQLICSFCPLLLFGICVMTAGVLTAGLIALLGLLVLIPVLVVTGVLGVVVWGWGLVGFLVGRWAWGVYVERMEARDREEGTDGVAVKQEKVDGKN